MYFQPFSLLKRLLKVGVFLFLVFVSSVHIAGNDIQDVLVKAQEKELYKHQTWLKLGHYKKSE